MPIQLSFSSMSTFLDCRRKFWWRYVRNLVLVEFNKAFLVGDVVHYGLFQLYFKNENALEDTITYFNKKVDELRAALVVSPAIEQSLIEQEYVIRGIITAYKERNSDIIGITEHLHNEHELKFSLPNEEGTDQIFIVAKLDNILLSPDGKFVHEIKTTKSVTPEYVKNIQNSLQAAIYFHGFNYVEKDDSKKLAGIIYDVIKKPSIRLKKNEAYDAYLQRLADYYDNPNDFDIFYMEIIKYPIITKQRAFETIIGIGSDILRLKDDKSKYYCNDKYCYIYSRCEYFDLCHFGENPNTLINFKDRDPGKSSTDILFIE